MSSYAHGVELEGFLFKTNHEHELQTLGDSVPLRTLLRKTLLPTKPKAMTLATAAALSITHGIGSPGLNLNLENGSSHTAYPRRIFWDSKFLRSKPKLFGRHLISQRQYQRLSITNDSTTPDLMIKEQSVSGAENGIGIASIHHVGLLCENLEKSLEFYQGLLGLTINNARPNDKLPYRGAWLWVGSEMIHLMELPNPDPLTGRPEHGGRDRHTCVAIKDVNRLKSIFDNAGITYTLSRSGRPAIFARDPDGNALEFTQVE